MGRAPRVPLELTERPFSLADARAAGLSWRSLQGKAWRRLATGLYVWNGLDADPWQVLTAWQDVLPPEAVFAGATAAWIAGLEFNPTKPVEIVVPPNSGMRSRPGLSVRRCRIVPGEVVTVQRLRATSLPRTIHHLSLRLPAVEILVAMDAALRKKLAPAKAFGGRKLQRLAAMAAPAESPMETRLRWLLIQRGLPRPEVQVDLGDAKTRLGRVDLYYPSARLILEYDGGNHRDRLAEDNRRQNRLLSAGFRLLRFTAGDIYNEPDVVAAQVRSALAGATPRRAHFE